MCCAFLSACDAGGYTSLGGNRSRDGSVAPGRDGGVAPGRDGGVKYRPLSSVLSGLPWPSGANASSLADIEGWAAYRGRANDVALVLTDYTSWAGVTRPDARLDLYEAFEGTLVIGQPFWAQDSGGSLALCAAGNYDDDWRVFGDTLVAHGRQASVVRLAWQFNGNDVEWSATEPANWVACFRRVVAAIRERAPEVLIDWSMNAHGTEQPAGGDTFDVYPGDEFVDIVGIDAYDMTPSSPDEASFTTQCRGPEGICSVADFARRHGKRLGVGQWAVVTCNGFGDRGDRGGDNPFYVERMHRLFRENADIMGYETYYSDRKSSTFCTSLLSPVDAPLASARYKALWAP